MRYLFILILFISNNYVFSQDYIPLVKEGKYWVYNHYSHSSCFLMGWHSTEVRYFSGDTLINSKLYKKLISSLATSQLPPYEISSMKTLCCMREDTLQRKVFMVNFDENVFPCVDSSSEILIWDFGMKAGDTLPDCLIKIFNPVDFGDEKSFVLDSIHGKEFYCLGVPPGVCGDLALWPVKFIEGFGMEDGPIYKRFGTFFKDYCEGTFEDCHIISSSHDVVQNTRKHTLYPNPTSGSIHINGLEIPVSVTISNVSGQHVKICQDVMDEVDISDIPAGMYILDIRGKDFREQHKIVKVE
ncbi:MAG: T9SS type A sorting domain-containing protein [Lewinellaceae bacterium]|nr:T9SS type A sorting domain-containing protein [Lewinellaceae bacterium]